MVETVHDWTLATLGFTPGVLGIIGFSDGSEAIDPGGDFVPTLIGVAGETTAFAVGGVDTGSALLSAIFISFSGTNPWFSNTVVTVAFVANGRQQSLVPI